MNMWRAYLEICMYIFLVNIGKVFIKICSAARTIMRIFFETLGKSTWRKFAHFSRHVQKNGKFPADLSVFFLQNLSVE